MSHFVEEWLSNIDTSPEERPTKRRRLFEDYTRRSRSKSDPGAPSHALTPPAHSLDGLEVHTKRADSNMADGRGQMLPPSPQTKPSNPETQSDSNVSRSSSRARRDQIESPSYRRRVLAANNVFIERRIGKVPPDILSAWSFVSMQAEGEEPSTQLSDMNALLDTMCDCAEEDLIESRALEIWRSHGLFPQSDPTPGISVKSNAPFNKLALPSSNIPTLPTISQPFPDLSYGYTYVIFSSPQETETYDVPEYAPTNNLFFPFLVVEAKSQVTGQNLWQATNQCAGGGSACVNAINRLFERYPQVDKAKEARPRESEVTHLSIGQPVDHRQPAESEVGVAFSLAIDTEYATLYIHWKTPNEDRFFQYPVQDYSVWKSDDLLRLQGNLKAIVQWGMGVRLKMVKRMIGQIATAESRKRSYIQSLG